MKWYKKEHEDGIHLYLKLNKDIISKLIEQLQNLKGDTPEMCIILAPENELNALRINVLEETKPTEVTKKTKRWFNGMHEFDSIQTKTPAQPTSLGINVGDGSKTGEKIG